MNKKSKLTIASSAALLISGCALFEPSNPMTFFITSTGSGKGGDLGGIAPRDTRHGPEKQEGQGLHEQVVLHRSHLVL